MLLAKEQSQLTELSNPFSPLHGSTLKFQSVFPNTLPIFFKASTAQTNNLLKENKIEGKNPRNT